jgi:hypothetical protein
VLFTRRYLVRRHDGVHNGGRGVISADAAVADALAPLLDPLEELRQEEFHTEPSQGTRLAPAAATKLAHAMRSGVSAVLAVEGPSVKTSSPVSWLS